MLHELILAKNVLAGIFEVSLDAVVSQSLTIELKRCCAEPSFLVDKQLVNPVLETFTTSCETSMVDEEVPVLAVHKSGVVSLGNFTCSLETEAIVGRHQKITHCIGVICTVVHLIPREDGTLAFCIGIRSINIAGTERPHHIALVRLQTAIGHKQVIIITDMLDVGTLTRHIITTCDTLAEIGVAGGTASTISD